MVLLQRCAVLLMLAFSVTESFPGRSIGAQEVKPYSIGYQASLQDERGRHFCGGTLVHPQWVVSAAHCEKLSSLIRVVLSEHNLEEQEGREQVLNVSEIFLPNYNHRTYDNDIMLLKLSRPAILNRYVKVAPLPKENTPAFHNNFCKVSGWSRNKLLRFLTSPKLRAVYVKIITNCQDMCHWRKITYNMVCAGSQLRGKRSCLGDSGGPLICNGNLEGIASWSIACESPVYHGVFTRVRNYTKWINGIINQNTA